ncbi:MAG: amino acid ABC transporter substrate-binding protein [Streptococcaceae bacterium]|jgi:polar amino acid transport system substrate-binding protein|nr:amino acid ABC transporter substrate-binding protein [Streptococcaceae bacterium]
MKILKRISLILASILVLISLSACQQTAKDTWSKIQAEKNKTITIGFDDTFVPMGFKDTDGTYKGFDIDLANAVFKKYGITVKWQPINWAMKETELKAGQIDLIWNGYTKTPEREKQVLFSEPYMTNKQVLVVKATSGITSTADMKGKAAGVQSGSSGFDDFSAYPKVLKNIVKGNTITQYSTFDLGFIDLKANKIQGLLVDSTYANYYLEKSGQRKDYKLVATEYPNEEFAVGARKTDKTLIAKINSAINSLHADGEFQKISEKWFGKDVFPKN